jgi:hypothetical protein
MLKIEYHIQRFSRHLQMADEYTGYGGAMCQISRLWVKNQCSEALALADEWIAKAEQEKELYWMDMLCLLASSVAESMQNFGLAVRYCENVLSHDDGKDSVTAMALYNMAGATFRQGEIDLAKQYAARSYALASHSEEKTKLSLAELLVKVWPDVVNWKA